MDNESGFGEEDDSNTGEVGERELPAGVQCTVRRKMKHDAWMNDIFCGHNSNLSQGTHVVCTVQ